MKSRSTISQMLICLNSVYSVRGNNSPAIFIYFEVRKAFDSVSLQIILSKFVDVGFGTVFLTFLTLI